MQMFHCHVWFLKNIPMSAMPKKACVIPYFFRIQKKPVENTMAMNWGKSLCSVAHPNILLSCFVVSNSVTFSISSSMPISTKYPVRIAKIQRCSFWFLRDLHSFPLFVPWFTTNLCIRMASTFHVPRSKASRKHWWTQLERCMAVNVCVWVTSPQTKRKKQT